MKETLKKFRIVFLVSFILSFCLTGVAWASTSGGYAGCTVATGGSTTCSNTVTLNPDDKLASFTHRMDDWITAPDAYHIHFGATYWYPSNVTGSPVYQTYWITDLFNNKTLYTNTDYSQSPLANYSQIAIGTNVTAGYYPGKSPQTELTMANASAFSCAGFSGVLCITISQISEHSVQ